MQLCWEVRSSRVAALGQMLSYCSSEVQVRHGGRVLGSKLCAAVWVRTSRVPALGQMLSYCSSEVQVSGCALMPEAMPRSLS